MVQDVGMLYSPRVMSREVNIAFYQRTFLGTSANQKRHYLKSYSNIQLLTFVEVNIRIYRSKIYDIYRRRSWG